MAANGRRDLGDFWATPGTVEALVDLWCNHRDISAAEIGRRLGCSKCAVISKAHRLDLPPRKEPAAAPPSRVLPFDTLAGNGCRWPIGHPSDSDFHFCGDPSVPGRSYCEHHRKQATGKPTRGEAMATKLPAFA